MAPVISRSVEISLRPKAVPTHTWGWRSSHRVGRKRTPWSQSWGLYTRCWGRTKSGTLFFPDKHFLAGTHPYLRGGSLGASGTSWWRANSCGAEVLVGRRHWCMYRRQGHALNRRTKSIEKFTICRMSQSFLFRNGAINITVTPHLRTCRAYHYECHQYDQAWRDLELNLWGLILAFRVIDAEP